MDMDMMEGIDMDENPDGLLLLEPDYSQEIPDLSTTSIMVPELTQGRSIPFLTEQEMETIDISIQQKLAEGFQELQRTHRDNIERFEGVLAEQKGRTLTSELMKERNRTEEFVEKYRKALSQNNNLEDTVRMLKSSESEIKLQLQQLTSRNENLVLALEDRNKELRKLSTDLSNNTQLLQAATLAKIEAISKVDELTSKELELNYREKQIEAEQKSISSHVALLNEQLDRKCRELIELQRESSLRYLNLQTEMFDKTEQLRIAVLNLENVKDTAEKQEQHITGLIEKLKDAQDMEMKMEESHRLELKSQKRIADLYKESSEESSKKVDELEQAVASLQDLLKMATDKYGELELEHSKSCKMYQEEVALRDSQIEFLSAELTEAKELFSSIKKQGITEEMLHSLSPAAAAANVMLRTSSSPNDLYSRYRSLQENFRQIEEENIRLNTYVRQIEGPEFQEQREDYDQALETVAALKTQLDQSMKSEGLARANFAEARKRLGVLERENARLKTAANDSNIQIRTLLRQVEAHRGNYVFSLSTDAQVPDSSLTDSSSVISAKLVTFKNIEELQGQNQQLLAIVRELTDERLKNEDTVEMKQLKISFESLKNEVQELRELRDQQELKLQSVLEQRDTFANLVEQKKSPHKSPMKSPGFATPSSTQLNVHVEWEKKLSESSEALKSLQEDYTKYRTQKEETQKALNAQIERLRDDLSRMRSDNAKLASQTEYNNERAKIYKSNLESYKKNIEILEEKNKAATLTVMKLEQTIVTLNADASTNLQKINRLELNLANAVQETDALKDTKSQLQTQLEILQREQNSQKILQTSLAEIKNNLEMNNSAAKEKLENQVESLEQELSILRRKMESESTAFRDVVLSWDTINKELQSKLDQEIENVATLRKDLSLSQDTIKTQRDEIEDLLSKIRVLTGANSQAPEQLLTAAEEQGGAISSLSRSDLDNKTYELKQKLAQAQNDNSALQQRLELTKGSIDEYKALCVSLEDQLKSVTDSSKSLNEELQDTLANKEAVIRQLREKIDSAESENIVLRNQKEELAKQVEIKPVVEDNELGRLRRELTVANSMAQSIAQECAQVREDWLKQMEISCEFQRLYQRESSQLATLRESQAALVSELDSLRLRVAGEETSRVKAQAKLKEIEESWEEEVSVFQREISQLKENLNEVDTMNTSLQDQLISFTNELSPVKSVGERSASGSQTLERSGSTSNMSDSTLNTAFIEPDDTNQTHRTTTQWAELVKFMRTQKESAYSRMELAEANLEKALDRLKQSEKHCGDMQAQLELLRDSSQSSAMGLTKEAELLRKVETLSALTDSNRMLREQQTTALAEIEKLKSEIEELQKELRPLRQSQAALESQCEVLVAENADLKLDVTEWRGRASLLMEKSRSSKDNPDEWKKLETENETLSRQSRNLHDSLKKQQVEISKLQQRLKENEEIQNQKESQKVRDLEESLTKAQAELEKQKGIVKQVKTIARRYKKSSEDSQKEIEGLKLQIASLEARVSTSASAAASAAVASEASRHQASEVASGQESNIRSFQTRIAELGQESQSLKRDIENLMQREVRAKAAIKSLRDKNIAAAQQREEIDTELSTLRDKVRSLESANELGQAQVGALKSQYEGRLSRLERENNDLKAHQVAQQEDAEISAREQSQLQEENERLKREIETQQQRAAEESDRMRSENEAQQQRILALERRLTLISQTTAASTQSKAGSSSSSDMKGSEPATANVKPMAASTSSKQATQVVQPGPSRPQPTASIRPMSMTRQVLVLPNASGGNQNFRPRIIAQRSSSVQSQPAVQTVAVAPVSQGQVSTSTPDQSSGASDSTQHIPVVPMAALVSNSTTARQQLVHPTPSVSIAPVASAVHTSGAAGTGTAAIVGISAPSSERESQASASGSQQEGPSTSTSTSHMGDSEMSDSSEQVSSSDPSSHGPTLTVAPLRMRVSDEEPQAGSSSQMAREEPSPSTSTSRPTQSTKRTRDESEGSEAGDVPDSKRLCVSQSMGVGREADAMGRDEDDSADEHMEHAEDDDDEDDEDSEDEMAEEDEEDDSDSEAENQQPPAPSGSGRAQFVDEDDSDVVVLSSDEEDNSPPPLLRQLAPEPVQYDEVEGDQGSEDEDEEGDEEDEEQDDSDNDEDESDDEGNDDDEPGQDAIGEARQGLDDDGDIDDVDDEGREAESLEDRHEGSQEVDGSQLKGKVQSNVVTSVALPAPSPGQVVPASVPQVIDLTLASDSDTETESELFQLQLPVIWIEQNDPNNTRANKSVGLEEMRARRSRPRVQNIAPSTAVAPTQPPACIHTPKTEPCSPGKDPKLEVVPVAPKCPIVVPNRDKDSDRTVPSSVTEASTGRYNLRNRSRSATRPPTVPETSMESDLSRLSVSKAEVRGRREMRFDMSSPNTRPRNLQQIVPLGGSPASPARRARGRPPVRITRSAAKHGAQK